MNRNKALEAVSRQTHWDVVIIGGGASGLGCAVDAATRGLKTLLLEKVDFAKGTSSRSTKLIHGGVRYLKQGNVSLVLEALHERGLLIKNAPHLVHHQSFVVPLYDWWEGPFYGAGLKVYDLLAGKLGLKPSRILGLSDTLSRIPTIEPAGLKGGVMYYDGQFDDARLAINLAKTAVENGAVLLNYAGVTGFGKSGGLIQSVRFTDHYNDAAHEVTASVVINATGVFSDALMQMDDENHVPVIQPSQGIHIVLDRRFLPGDSAIMVPQTDDGRVLFAVPWYNRVIVGTTDTEVGTVSDEPVATDQEIDFLLSHAARYLTHDPKKEDVKSVFAGLRPLIRSSSDTKSAALSRDHAIFVSESGLISVTGGKWTTYRKMAQDTVDQALIAGGFGDRPCLTASLPIHGSDFTGDRNDPRQAYGSDLLNIESLILHDQTLAKKIHLDLPYLWADLAWSIDHEMALTTEDLLSRRTRSLLLDADAAQSISLKVSEFLAHRLGKPASYAKLVHQQFLETSSHYTLNV